MLHSYSELFNNSKTLKNSGNLKSQKGTISIISIGIFLVLMVFILIMYLIIQGIMADIRANNSQEEAEQIADNMMQYLSDFIDQNELIGYNTEFHCEFNVGGIAVEGEHPLCIKLAAAAGNEEVVVDGEIKGRLEIEESMASNRCVIGGNNVDCFVVPSFGSGDAGVNCEDYDPYDDQESNVDPELVGQNNIDQLDYACNWNKINSREVVEHSSIPLFYKSGIDETINPLFSEELLDYKINNFTLRVRPPCLPCVYEEIDLIEGQNRLCNQESSQNFCTDNMRYDLEGDPPENYLVDWEFNGDCQLDAGAEECVFISDIGVSDPLTLIDSENTNEGPAFFYRILTSTDEISAREQITGDPYFDIYQFEEDYSLLNMHNVWLNLKPTSVLNFQETAGIPYLEYQFLSDRPVANPEQMIKLKVHTNGANINMALTKKINM